MPAPITIILPEAFAKLSAGLTAYRAVSGQDASAVLLQKGAQVVFGNKQSRFGASFLGLVQLFRHERPADGEIYNTAKARGFRLGTKTYSGQLSLNALARASEIMGGYKSVIASGSGVPGDSLSFARVNKRGRRVHLRRGRKSFAVSGGFAGPLPAGQKRLNFRAVATYFELGVRTHGRGFLGAGFLFQRWRKLAQSDPRRQELHTFRIVQNVNARSSLSLLGEAALTGDTTAGNVELRLTSYVPGTAAVGTSRGLFAQVIASINADIGVYLARKQREGLLAAILSGKAA